jgi:hypothetical protein
MKQLLAGVLWAGRHSVPADCFRRLVDWISGVSSTEWGFDFDFPLTPPRGWQCSYAMVATTAQAHHRQFPDQHHQRRVEQLGGKRRLRRR